MEKKKDIRRQVIAERNEMSKEQWWEESLRITDKLITHPFFLSADEIYCYIDCKNEVATKKIFEEAWKQGKKTACPKVIGDEMEFYYIQSFEELEPGYFGVKEPITTMRAQGKKVLVIMPGVAFDKKNHRIGYGKGFYDKYLNRNSNYSRVAIAFSFQVLDDVPSDKYDMNPQLIFTEDNIYDGQVAK